MKLLLLKFRAPNGVPSTCGAILTAGPDGRDWLTLVELPFNPGMSITNAAEHIANVVVDALHLAPAKLRWFEHYPARDGVPAVLDAIHFNVAAPRRLHTPTWRPATHAERAWLALHTPLTLDAAPHTETVQ